MTPEKIKALRTALGETQTQFGERFAVKWMTVLRWEKGRTKPSAEIVGKLKEMAGIK